jgi:hypothetical protein
MLLFKWIKSFLKIMGNENGEKGKRDKGKREEQKKGKIIYPQIILLLRD